MRDIFLWGCAVLLVSGCGDDGPKNRGVRADGVPCTCAEARCGSDNCGVSCGTCKDDGLCEGGQCIAPTSCDLTGFLATTEAGYARYSGGDLRVRFSATNVTIEPPFDKLSLELSHKHLFNDQSPAPGTFPLTAATAEPSGGIFLRGNTFCNDVACAFPYIVDSGTLELEEPGVPGTHLRGWLRALRLKQARVNPETGELQTFSNAKTWCTGDLRFDVEVPVVSATQSQCVAAGTGHNIGDNIGDFSLPNCNGELVNLHDLCAKSEAVWLLASAGWCGACEAFVPQAAQRYRKEAEHGLELLVVLGEDNNGSAPTPAYCKAYAAAKGLDPALTLIDHDGSRSWPVLFGALNTYSGDSIGLPWNAVLDGRSMEYLWSSTAGDGTLYEVQDTLMNRPR